MFMHCIRWYPNVILLTDRGFGDQCSAMTQPVGWFVSKIDRRRESAMGFFEPGFTKESWYLGLSENVVYPIVPNGFADHYPY